MRIAGFVNHQIVERILHFFTREVSLFECVLRLLGGVLLPDCGVVSLLLRQRSALKNATRVARGDVTQWSFAGTLQLTNVALHDKTTPQIKEGYRLD